jgi:hypothetical protein
VLEQLFGTVLRAAAGGPREAFSGPDSLLSRVILKALRRPEPQPKTDDETLRRAVVGS